MIATQRSTLLTTLLFVEEHIQEGPRVGLPSLVPFSKASSSIPLTYSIGKTRIEFVMAVDAFPPEPARSGPLLSTPIGLPRVPAFPAGCTAVAVGRNMA